MDNYCFDCGGEGLVGKPCPTCGKIKEVGIKLTDQKPAKIIENSEIMEIPSQYVGVEWFKDKLIKCHADKECDMLFKNYAIQLDKVHSMFKEGFIPNKSGIIMAPRKYSKLTWAYSCMQLAKLHGFKVAPLLSTLEVHRLLVLGAYKPEKKLFNKIDYDEYLTSEVVFVTVTKTGYCVDAFEVIDELVDIRTRLGLPTFIISRFDLKDMSKRDYKRSFESIIDYNNVENRIKYPIMVSYFENELKGR